MTVFLWWLALSLNLVGAVMAGINGDPIAGTICSLFVLYFLWTSKDFR